MTASLDPTTPLTLALAPVALAPMALVPMALAPMALAPVALALIGIIHPPCTHSAKASLSGARIRTSASAAQLAMKNFAARTRSSTEPLMCAPASPSVQSWRRAPMEAYSTMTRVSVNAPKSLTAIMEENSTSQLAHATVSNTSAKEHSRTKFCTTATANAPHR